MKVKAKKHLGQHFLKDPEFSEKIADALTCEGYNHILEIGPGTGALTQFLLRKNVPLDVVELDHESVEYLNRYYPQLQGKIHSEDFLEMDLNKITDAQLAIAGNFPYNISSQILFRLIDYKDKCPELVGMFQKEVARRVISPPGSKEYGILSVLVQTFYSGEYLFTVDEDAFDPPPKVKSGVIRLKRLPASRITADYTKFKFLIKTAFNQRRKTLRNSLKSLGEVPEKYSHLRPEQLSVEDFDHLTQLMIP